MHRLACIAALTSLATTQASGQGLPAYVSLNPVLTSRSGVYFQPYVDPARRWEVRLQTDYGNMIELSAQQRSSVLIDAEVLRLDATVIRNVGPGFVGMSAGLNGSYAGFLDGFLDWYHRITGLQVAARGLRPENRFAYTLELPNGETLSRPARSAFLGDVRLLAGLRHTRNWQTTLAVTAPTGPVGYGRGVVSASVMTTARFQLDHRWLTEMGLGAGFTPKHGDLADYQRTTFVGANLGFRYRFWGRQAVFVNAFFQSPNYHDTETRPLDKRELTLDYGFLLKARKGPEWFLGMTEDLEPRGPAIDLAFRIGARW